MKHLKKYIFLLFSAALWGACSDDDSPVYNFQAAPELEPLVSPAFVLNENSQNFIVETFSWTKGNYGFQAAPLYILEVDNDKEFPDPIILGESSRPYLPVYVGKMNTAALILGAEAGIAHNLYARIQAQLTPDVSVYSEPIDFTVTPYASVIEYPTLYVPGSYQGWDIANAPALTSTRMNNKYEGYLNLVIDDNPNDAVTFKLTTKPAWGQGIEYGAGNAPGKLAEKGGDISISPQGYYLLKVDLNTLAYTAIQINTISVYGSATGEPASDIMLTRTPSGTWVNTISLQAGSFYFRINQSDDIRYGDTNNDGIIENQSSVEIPIPQAGEYTITLSLDKAPYTYQLTPVNH